MFARVFDVQANVYFKSEIYAVINSGWYEKQLVVVSSDNGSYFKFFDYLDKSDTNKPKVLINAITSDGFNSDFECIYQRTDDVDKKLDEYSELLDDNIRFFEYRGYSWIYENKPLLLELLKGGSVLTKNYKQQMPTPNAYKLEGWFYIEKQQDIDFILEQTSAFHDSVLKELNYISGAYVDDKNSMYCADSKRQITVQFDSQWCHPIEMVFEGVTAMNLRPSSDNHTSNIYGASLFLQNASVFFCDEQMSDVDKTYNGTWIESYSLRWRFID